MKFYSPVRKYYLWEMTFNSAAGVIGILKVIQSYGLGGKIVLAN